MGSTASNINYGIISAITKEESATIDDTLSTQKIIVEPRTNYSIGRFEFPVFNAISKVGTDLIGRYHAEAYNQKVQVTRMFTHTGPRRGDVFAESSFAKQIAIIETGEIEPIIKVGNLDSLRTFADVRDAVRAYYILLTKNPIAGAYYNIGGDYTCKISDMLDYLTSLSKINNIKIEIDKERLRPIDADLQIPNTNKFHKHTGWKPKISFQKTMQDLLEFWRKKVKKNPNQLLR